MLLLRYRDGLRRCRQDQRSHWNEPGQIRQQEHRIGAVEHAKWPRPVPQADQADSDDRARNREQDDQEDLCGESHATTRARLRIAKAHGDGQ